MPSSKRLIVTMPPQLMQRIREEAERRGLSYADVVRGAVDAALSPERPQEDHRAVQPMPHLGEPRYLPAEEVA